MKKLLLMGILASSLAFGFGLKDKIFGNKSKTNVAKEEAIVYSTDEGYEFKVNLDNNKKDDYITLSQGGSRADGFLPVVNVFLNKPLSKTDEGADILIWEAREGIIADTQSEILGNVAKIVMNLIDYDNDGIKEIVIECFDSDEFERVVLLAKYNKKEKNIP